MGNNQNSHSFDYLSSCCACCPKYFYKNYLLLFLVYEKLQRNFFKNSFYPSYYFLFFVTILCLDYLQNSIIPQIKDKKALTFVKLIHLDEATIAGTNIPPIPDEKLNNATLLGIDSNKNYIRDDVELAIYAKYGSSTQERVALLGYTQALEMRYRVYWKEGQEYVEHKINSFTSCLWIDLNPVKSRDPITDLPEKEERSERQKKFEDYEKVTRDMVDNTDLRKEYIRTSDKAFISFGGFAVGGEVCLLDFNKIK